MHDVLPARGLYNRRAERTQLVADFSPRIYIVIIVILAVIFWRAGLEPGSAEWVQSSRNNGGVVWALPGFLVWLGIQTVSLTFLTVTLVSLPTVNTAEDADTTPVESVPKLTDVRPDKCVPTTVTCSPTAALVGVTDVMVGAEAVTANESDEVTVPAGVVTVNLPDPVAYAGIEATRVLPLTVKLNA